MIARFRLTVCHQAADGVTSTWTKGDDDGRDFRSRVAARRALHRFKVGLVAADWAVADGCDHADSFAVVIPSGTRTIVEVTRLDAPPPASPYTPPAGSPARAMLDALDALAAQYDRSVEELENVIGLGAADRAALARWREQRQGIRAAIACARAAYADHRAG